MDNQRRYVTFKEKLSISFASVNSYVVSSMIASYLLYFYTDVFLLPMAAVPVLMGAARIWDTVNDPIMGILIDRTKNGKRGRMRKYFFYFTIPMGIFTALLFAAPDLSNAWKGVFAVGTYFIFDTLYTVTDVPLWSLISVTTPNTGERAKTLSLAVTVGSVGSVIPMLVVPMLADRFGERRGYFGFAAIIGLFGMCALFSVYRNAKERIQPVKEEKLPVKKIIRIASQNTPMLLTLLATMLSCTRYLLQISAVYVANYNIQSSFSPGTVQITIMLIKWI